MTIIEMLKAELALAEGRLARNNKRTATYDATQEQKDIALVVQIRKRIQAAVRDAEAAASEENGRNLAEDREARYANDGF